MKRPCLWFLGMALLLVPGWPASTCFAAEGPDLAGSYRETPNSLRLFIDQWTPHLPPTTKYTLDFLRTADEQTATLTLREAVVVGLENNPGIEVARLEPLRAAEQTMTEKSIFDPT